MNDTIPDPTDAKVRKQRKRMDTAVSAVAKCLSAHDALNTQDYVMETILQSLATPVFVLDVDGKFILANHAALAVGGWDLDDVFCKHFTSILTAGAQQRARGLFEQSARHGVSIFDQEAEVVFKDGSERLVRYSLNPVRVNQHIVAVTGTVEDITELRAVEDSLRASSDRYRELSIRDHLTGLFNLRHFFTAVDAEIARARRYGRPLSLIFMDLDDFKHYNDTWGHVEGDKVLQALGVVIRNSIRTTDHAFRYGGEEFTVLLPETPDEDAAVIAERIRLSFADHAFLPPGVAEPVRQTLSLGVAQFVDGDGFSDFVSRADHAMYVAKQQGKNQVIVDASL